VNARSKCQMLALLGGIFGWVWLFSIPFSIWYLVSAVFTDAPWSRFFWAAGIGFVSKNMLRGFEANKNRVALEARLTSNGVPEEAARELAFRAMNGAGDAP